MRLPSAILFAGLLLCGTTSVPAATIYKWVDDQGQTHFGSQPPAGRASQQFNSRSPSTPSAPNDSEQPAAASQTDPQQSKIDAEVKRQVAQEQAQLKTFCLDMRTRLSQLNNNPRLMVEVDGKPVRLREEERQQRILETEEKIRELCSGM